MTREEQLDTILRALANETRRELIHVLSYRPATVGELSELRDDMTMTGLIKHLKILESADLVQRKKVGRINFVALNPDSLQVVKAWINGYQSHWGSRRATLDNYISKHLDRNSEGGSETG